MVFGQTSRDKPEAGNHFQHLDFVRAVAVMLVFIGHLAYSLGHPYGFSTPAHFGVILFFVHTCLVLFQSMERSPRRYFFLNFYTKRIARIYPLAIVTVMIVILAHIPSRPWGSYSAPDWGTIATNVLLIQNIARPTLLEPMWSLPFEVQMYAVLPVLFLLHRRRRVRAWAIWAMGALVAGALWALPSRRPAEIGFYIPCFLAGIVAYSLLHRPRSLGFGWLAAAMAATLVAGMAAIHAGVNGQVVDSGLALAIGVIVGRYSVVPSLVAAVSAQIAKYSYGLYLAHFPIMWFCFAGGQRRWAWFAALSVVVPVALYHAIEKPFIRLGARAFAAGPEVTGKLAGAAEAAS